MATRRENFVPALAYGWLTRFYDPLMRLLMRDYQVKLSLVKQAGICDNHRVLDVGCGTARLVVFAKLCHPRASFIGVDADPKVLEIAKKNILSARLEVPLLCRMANATDLQDDSFDRVLSSLLFHHLRAEAKLSALAEAYRVLMPGGELHIADFGKPAGLTMRCAFLLVQALDGFASTADSVAGNLPDYMVEAGFTRVRCVNVINTILGSISFYRSQKPV